MLNKDVLLLNNSELRMGWKIQVKNLSGRYGATSAAQITPFGGAVSLNQFTTNANFPGFTTIRLVTPTDLGLFSIERSDTKEIFQVTDYSAGDNPGEIYWIDSDPHQDITPWRVLTSEDVGKTITVYYIPA